MTLARRIVVTENTSIGPGKDNEDRWRALTLVEKMYKDGLIDVDEYMAAGDFRNMFFLQEPPSQGVSPYGDNSGASDPTRKADRHGRRLTGYSVERDGTVERTGSPQSKRNRWAYKDAIFAMCGVHNDEGEKVIDEQLKAIMIEAITNSERLMTQGEIGRMRSLYGPNTKQLPAAGLTVAREALNKLARHLRYKK